MPLSKIQFGNTGRRNMVINGAMQIAQRGTDIDDIATDGQKNMDMFVTRKYGGNGTYDFDQSTDVPDSTFYYSAKLTVKSASTNTGTAGYAYEHRVEGYNMSRLRLGRSTAQPITVSFYVKSSVAGTPSGDDGNAEWSIVSRSPSSHARSASANSTSTTSQVTLPDSTCAFISAIPPP